MGESADVLVVGAGLAGLRAALSLASAGLRVSVFESRNRAGGRIRSIRPPGSLEELDLGQHLILGCYRHTLEMAAELGTASRLRPYRAGVPWRLPGGGGFDFRTWKLPPPLHAAPLLAGLKHIAPRSRLGLLKLAASAKLARLAAGKMPAGMDAVTWLRRNGQDETALEVLWRPLGEATLNTRLERASARMFAVVLERVLLSGPEASVPMLPDSTLDSVLVRPALAAIERSGGKAFLSTRVTAVENGRACVSIRTADGSSHTGRYLVLAVPWFALERLDTNHEGLRRIASESAKMEAADIVTVELWFDRRWCDWRMAGVSEGPLQWVFAHPPESSGPFRASCVFSCAGRYARWPSGPLVELCHRELVRCFAGCRRARLLSSAVVRTPAATIQSLAGESAKRPACRIDERIFLAGDWTDTGLPATIEGAVLSGIRAADSILHSLNRRGSNAASRN